MVPGFCLKARVLQNSKSYCQRGVVSALWWEVAHYLVHKGEKHGGLVKEVVQGRARVRETAWEMKKVSWRPKFPTKKAFISVSPTSRPKKPILYYMYTQGQGGGALAQKIHCVSIASKKEKSVGWTGPLGRYTLRTHRSRTQHLPKEGDRSLPIRLPSWPHGWVCSPSFDTEWHVAWVWNRAVN
jgi:hypothetical protein